MHYGLNRLEMFEMYIDRVFRNYERSFNIATAPRASHQPSRST